MWTISSALELTNVSLCSPSPTLCTSLSNKGTHQSSQEHSPCRDTCFSTRALPAEPCSGNTLLPGPSERHHLGLEKPQLFPRANTSSLSLGKERVIPHNTPSSRESGQNSLRGQPRKLSTQGTKAHHPKRTFIPISPQLPYLFLASPASGAAAPVHS